MSRNAAVRTTGRSNGHATVEELSAYLDRELEPFRLRLVETHLEECQECRRRADGLGRVVRDLRRLERFDPPPALGQHLLRRLHRSPRPRTLMERLEVGLGGKNLQSPVGFSFALVVAFAALLYFFAGSLDRHQRNQTSILRPALPSSSAAAPRTVGERTFRWSDGAWRQEGLPEEAVPREVEATSPAARQVLDREAELAELLAEGEPVVLEVEGAVLLIRPGSPDPDAPR
jgi:Putative zinc-finger